MIEPPEGSPLGSGEMALPRTTLLSLRKALRGEVGPLSAIHALHTAGFETGSALWPLFVESLGERDPSSLPRDRFWELLSDFLSDRGWGTVGHRHPHPALGILRSPDLVEAEEDARESQPSCAFTSGAFAGFLTSAAGGPLAVLEVRCRSRGDEACEFVFGSEDAIHHLYGALLDGAELERAFETLGSV